MESVVSRLGPFAPNNPWPFTASCSSSSARLPDWVEVCRKQGSKQNVCGKTFLISFYLKHPLESYTLTSRSPGLNL